MKGENRWVNPQAERNSFIAETQVEIALNGETKNINGKPSNWSNHRFKMRQSGNQGYAEIRGIGIVRMVRLAIGLMVKCLILLSMKKIRFRGLSQINYFLGADYRSSVPLYNSDLVGSMKALQKTIMLNLYPDTHLIQRKRAVCCRLDLFHQEEFQLKPNFTGHLIQRDQLLGIRLHWKMGSDYHHWVNCSVDYSEGIFFANLPSWHHNFWEDFVFEPGLDEEFDSSKISELQKRNVWQILLFTDPWGQDGTIKIIGLNGKLRDP